MEISLRLAEILEEHQGQRRGCIKQICDHTSLERHQVAALLKNRAKYISLETLGALCTYLIEHHQVDPLQLPGILFAREPGEFWALLAERRYLEVCLGLRRTKEFVERGWVMACDSSLQGELLYGMSGADITRTRKSGGHWQILEQRLVQSPDHPRDGEPLPRNMEDVRRGAEGVYDLFGKRTGDRALVCLGSMKSNPVVEVVLANAFHTKPFKPIDKVRRLRDCAIPFVFRYRERDAKPPSCCGCFAFARPTLASEPGIYYEDRNGRWICCPWKEGADDAALVFYSYRPPQGRLEMVLGGFSGRATRCLVRVLRENSAKLWPPSYSTSELRVGAFIVRFEFKSAGTKTSPKDSSWPSSTEIIPLSKEVLENRLKP